MDNQVKNKIIKAFEDNEISKDCLSIGSGKYQADGKRYKQEAPETYKHDNTIKYVIKYIVDIKMCIVWKKIGKRNTEQSISRNVFSIKADIVNSTYTSNVTTKYVEFYNRFSEKVLICDLDFLTDKIKEFLD